MYKKHNQEELILSMQSVDNWQSIEKNVIHHINWKKGKPHDHINKCRKRTWQNPTPIYDKNSQ